MGKTDQFSQWCLVKERKSTWVGVYLGALVSGDSQSPAGTHLRQTSDHLHNRPSYQLLSDAIWLRGWGHFEILRFENICEISFTHDLVSVSSTENDDRTIWYPLSSMGLGSQSRPSF